MKIEFKHTDEKMPGIDNVTNTVVQFLISHHKYLVPFFRILTNMPINFVGNPRFSKVLEKYLINEFMENQYYLDNTFYEKDTKSLISMLISYFAFYDDYDLQLFVKNNSRFAPKGTSPEALQNATFKRLKGYLFEKLVCEILAPNYNQKDCLFSTGCIVIIDGTPVTITYKDKTRKTIDVAGIKHNNTGIMLECKVHPDGIQEITAKYNHHLYKNIRDAGYTNVNVGFITAGTKMMTQMRLKEQLTILSLTDPGLTVLDVADLVEIITCA